MAKQPIQIDLRRDLPKVREQLEAILPNMGKCLYSAPCAIGAMLPEAARQRLAESGRDETAIEFLPDTIKIPKGQRGDAGRLQSAFDSGDVEWFKATLSALEAKYLTEQAA